jgi:hypothetical protein
MKNRMSQISSKLLWIWIMIFLFPEAILAQTFTIQGLLSGWIVVNKSMSNKTQSQLGLRSLPEFSLKKSIYRELFFDADLSLNVFGSGEFHSLNRAETSGKAKLYRMWLRFSSPRFEARLGLQKINFGSAMLLRPLMWFDRIDPRDPLQMTDGVYGLLLRYYFLNNTNIWLWGLYGNEGTKGWEFFPTNEKSFEYGGRLQAPLPRGEIAFTYHHRQMDLSKDPFAFNQPQPTLVPENRFGLDGKWDINIGIWFEATLVHQRTDLLPFSYQRSMTFGLDYTFKLGKGLHLLTEYFVLDKTKKISGRGEGFRFSALSLDYPLGLMDSLTSIFYYDWKNNQFYRFLNWQRKYDRWSLYFIAFWNPEKFEIYQVQQGNSLFSGKGIQFMVVFNY